MKVNYYPKIDNSNGQWKEIPGQTVGLAIAYPDLYDPNKEYGFVMIIHGIGETQPGVLSMLENLVKGTDYNGDGVREGAPFLTKDLQKAIDQYGLIVAVPNYDGFFDPNKVNFCYDFVRSKFNVVPEMLMEGFSYGGGAVLNFTTSNSTNAQKVAYAIPCAPVSSISDPTIPGKTNLPVHFFVNVNDSNGATNINVTKSCVTSINSSNPAIKAIYTAFNKSGHGGHDEALTLTPPEAPGGQGFIDAGENVYQVYLDILKNGPRQMRSKSGSITTTTTRAPNPSTTSTTTQAPVPALIANAGGDQTVNLPTGFLDGTRSTGYKSAQWYVKQRPSGVNPWYPVVQSGGWITTKLSLPLEGTYVITLRVFSGENYTGTVREDDVLVNYTTTGQPPTKILLQKVFIPNNNNYVYVYDDGSVETKSQ